MLRARRAIQDLREYRPPLGDRLGLRMDFNENTVGASPRVLHCLRELTLEQLARYPERESVELSLAVGRTSAHEWRGRGHSSYL